MTPQNKLVLVTGVTGYIGGCLVPRLLENGYQVRLLVREPVRLFGRSWFPKVDVVDGDILSPDNLSQAMQGVSTAYYLIHNMASGGNYTELEIDSAHKFVTAAGVSGVEHIIYLGGLADPAEDIGSHLRSRIITGDTLRQGNVPVTEFRASLIIGSGSISFELIRYLTEQFPILIGPSWLHNRTQPIAIQNVVDYLVSALDYKISRGKIYEIGGMDTLTYANALSVYARLRGLRRNIIAMPGLSVNLMAWLIGIFTPIPARIAAPLLGGMRTDSVVCDDSANRDFPNVDLLSFEASVSQALDNLSPSFLESGWENSASSFRIKREGFFILGQRIQLPMFPGAVHRAITGLGGVRGWLYMNWLWKIRGSLDKLAGGPGMRGRRMDSNLVEGDTLDFYRVEVLNPDRILLKSELKSPGLGWMEWRIQLQDEGKMVLSQTAYFAPRGLIGFLYWYILLPVHHLVFTGLLKSIARQAGDNDKER